MTSMKTTFKYAYLAVLLLFALGAVAQGHSSATEAPAFTSQGAFVAIVVTDIDASVHWYESRLGLHVVKRGKSPRVPAETVVLGGHNLFVELIHHDGKQLPRVENEASVPRLLKAGVIVGQKDFDALAAYLQKRGVETGIFEDKEMGVRSCLFRDNDGNLIQFFTQNE
jgi:catechol 2,3-dioxygenase-like lactoylglutathione lyase family enzyme